MAYEPDSINIDTNPDLLRTAFEKVNANLAAIAAALNSAGGGVFNYLRTGLTGGTENDLDGIDGAELSGGELAAVVIDAATPTFRVYLLDADNGGAESSPSIIAPDANPGDKMWVLIGQLVLFGATAGTACEGNDGRLPTTDQKAAMAGTSGTPSSSNKYVTSADSALTDARTPIAHTASHKHNGSDEVATATAAVNAIPKAGADGKLDGGWLPDTLGGRTV